MLPIRLREGGPSAKILFLTVHSEQQFIEARAAEGALGYVLHSRMKACLTPAAQAALVEASGTRFAGPTQLSYLSGDTGINANKAYATVQPLGAPESETTGRTHPTMG
jgi:DNA-binding NarL/FixJ family response regulator